MDSCVFCRIAAHQAAAHLVYEDEEAVAFHDLHPQAPVHLLVIPRRHLPSLAAAGEADAGLLGHLLVVAARVAQAAGLAEKGYRLVTNSGPDAGQSVFHVHLHVLGGRRLRWPPG